jgi:gluconolactonase
MTLRTYIALSSALVCSLTVGQGQGQAQGNPPQPPPTETVAPDIPGVVKAGTKVQVIMDGFQGTEGPITLPDGSVVFTETNASRVTKISKEGNVSSFLENSNGSNALTINAKGLMISAQTTPGHTGIGVIYPHKNAGMLVDNFEGKPFGRPNDLVSDKKGGIYFSDPANVAASGPPAVLPPAVYYLPPSGKVMKVAEGMVFPNGVALSPNEKILYVSDTRGADLLAFDIEVNGSLKNRRNFAAYEGVQKTDTGVNSGADGLAIDADGRIYVATLVGVQVFSPKGKQLGTIPLSRQPQNLAFAGADKKTLYVVGRGAAFKIQMIAQGYMGRGK